MDEPTLLPPIEADETKRGPGCIVLPALLLVLVGVGMWWSQAEPDFSEDHERVFEHWLGMCSRQYGEATCREFAGAKHPVCYEYAGGGKIGPNLLRERSVEQLYRGEFIKERYWTCMDRPVKAAAKRKDMTRR